MKLVVTCEHASNELPEEFYPLFKNALPVLQTHRGYDPGALDMYEHLLPLADFSLAYKKSRLLIEPNRSLHHPNLFSEFTMDLSREDKDSLINTLYLPYRDEVEVAISNFINNKEEVLHLSIHSFTPVLNGVERNTDLGLLYDPSRIAEKEFCTRYKTHFNVMFPGFKLRFNYPYKGNADGFTTYLRNKFPANYMGIELEVNQKFARNNSMSSRIKAAVYTVLKNLLLNQSISHPGVR